MKISNLVDYEYTTASILEDTRDIFEWLRGRKYLAIMDENQTTVGIVTVKDLQQRPDSRNVIDLLFEKPRVQPDQTVIEVYQLMKETDNDCLPVYDCDKFLGVITLMGITTLLVESLWETKQTRHQGMAEIHSTLVNMQGLNSLLGSAETIEKRQEIAQLTTNCCTKAMGLTELILTPFDDEKI